MGSWSASGFDHVWGWTSDGGETGSRPTGQRLGTLAGLALSLEAGPLSIYFRAPTYHYITYGLALYLLHHGPRTLHGLGQWTMDPGSNYGQSQVFIA